MPCQVQFQCHKLWALGLFLMGWGYAHAAGTGAPDLLSLSIQDLLNVKVISVSKQEETLSDVAASIYVITQNDIRNAGVTTIPEALRLAPRLQVARLSSTQYAISMRGFNNTVSNKLLVLIDGRTVYAPLFSGVFWDQQDVLLEDVERIEIISGPGATVWGTNAVNGVINVITRDAATSTGWLAAAHAGDFERGARLRYGSQLGNNGHFRVYSKFFETDSNRRPNGSNPYDGVNRIQAGFRADWDNPDNHLTLQGDIYDGETENRITPAGVVIGPIETSGNNLLVRWRRQLEGGSDLRLQGYWDYTKRRDIVLFQPRTNIFDFDFQHGIPMGEHRFSWGMGYRHGRDEVKPAFFSTFVPERRILEWKTLFGMGEVQITDQLDATVGVRLEHNDYTGLEYLPTLRLGWKHRERALLWTALSRAVRAPARYDRDVYFPAPPNSRVVGGPNFQSEVANVLEIGYRSQAWKRLTYSATAYYHDWDKLRSGTAPPVEIVNGIEGEVYGLEFWLTYQLTPTWKVSAGGTRLHKDLRLKPGSTGQGVDSDILSNDPDYLGQLRSTLEITHNMLLEIGVRHMAELPHPEIPSYTTIDAHYAWELNKELTLSLTAQNLTDNIHQEFGRPGSVIEFSRAAWLTATWTQ